MVQSISQWLQQNGSLSLSVIAILISCASLGWQMSTQRRRVKQDLYEKHFGLVQTIMSAASHHALVVASNSLPAVDPSDPMAQWKETVRQSGGLPEEQMKELQLAVQHIQFHFDAKTAALATQLLEELEVTQQLAYKRAQAHVSNTFPADFLQGAKANHDAVMETTNKLVSRMSKELYLR